MLKTPVSAQLLYQLNLINTDSQAVFKKISYKKQVTNKEFISNEINKVYVSLINEGYISANVDSIKSDSLKYTCFITIGKKYKSFCGNNYLKIIEKRMT